MKAVLIFRRRRLLIAGEFHLRRGFRLLVCMGVFVWYYANLGDIHLTFSGVSRLTFA